MAKRTAVIDIGSNSVRMVIFEKTSRFAFSLLHESKSRVRISEGAYRDEGRLQPEAIERAVNALKDFRSIAHAYGSRKLLCVATSAVREAPNHTFFLKRVRDELGINIKVIDGERESYLGGVACANLLQSMKARTIDIGGGSTECASIENGAVHSNLSLNLGTVRLKELFFDRGNLEGAVKFIDAQLASLPAGDDPTVVGIGGTFRALAQIMMKTHRYPMNKLHGFTVPVKDLFDLGEKILAASNDNDLKNLGVKKERFDVIRPGTLILMRFLKHVGCTTLVTSGAGVREGLYLTDLLRHNRDRFPEGYNPSLRCLLDRHTVEPRFANQLTHVAQKLFDLLQPQQPLPQEFRPILGIAAKLAKVGASVHFYSYHKSSQFLVESALEYGYSHKEIMTVAALVRYHKSKKIGKPFYAQYKALLPDLKTLNRLTMLLAISDALLAHRPRNIDFELGIENGMLIIRTAKGKHLYLAREKFEALGIGKELKVRFV